MAVQQDNRRAAPAEAKSQRHVLSDRDSLDLKVFEHGYIVAATPKPSRQRNVCGPAQQRLSAADQMIMAVP
jgi:hypothetical protein